MTARLVRFAVLGSAFLLAGCDGGSPTSPAGAAPTAPSSLPASNITNWIADGAVVSVTGGACDWHPSVGDTMANWKWRITITAESILLEQDDDGLSYIPFAGTLTDRQFTAAYSGGGDNPEVSCRYRGGTLTGSFSEGLSSFEAVDTSVWASPGGEMTVQRRWVSRPR